MTGTPAEIALIADLEDQRWAAILEVDVATLTRLVSDDLTYTHSNGRRDTKASYLELIPNLRYQSAVRSDREIQVFGNVAIVTGRADIKIFNQEGGIRDISIRYTNVWLENGDDWLFTAWHATPIVA